MMNEPGYEKLAAVLQMAYDQAAKGKGKERHANGKPFHRQPMQDLIRLHGVGFATGQASKKASEALGLPITERQVAELLGAIVYLAGAVIALKRDESQAELDLADSEQQLDLAFHKWFYQDCPKELADKVRDLWVNSDEYKSVYPSPQVDQDGFTPWRGGVRPVPRDTKVQIKLRCGQVHMGNAGSLNWSHDGETVPGFAQIIAYKVVIDAQ